MATEQVSYVEITRLEDDLLLPWLDLYEITFPPEEKILVSNFLTHLKNKANKNGAGFFMLAAVQSQTTLVGIACFQVFPEQRAAMLWYLAVGSRQRNQGLGGEIYQEIIRRIDPAKYSALIMEVEIPELCHTQEARQYATRRIGFYQRQGAFRLGGVRYLQFVGKHLPPTPMHILVHPFRPISPQAAFDLVCSIIQDAMTQTGELTLN